jgi:hypothetical protein
VKILSKTEEWAFQNSGRRKKLPKQVSGGEELYVQAVNVALQLDLSRNNVIPVTSIPMPRSSASPWLKITLSLFARPVNHLWILKREDQKLMRILLAESVTLNLLLDIT